MAHRSPTSAYFIRGLAIIPVFVLHWLANIKAPIYHQASTQFWAVFIDQLGRYCVPLFVALSGYGLSKGYGEKSFSWLVFWWRRALKLLPVYFIWSFTILGVILLVPAWQWPGFKDGLMIRLLFGAVDYHLYFVPMIFQLYLAFPFLNFLIKRWPKELLAVTAVMHLLIMWAFDTDVPFFHTFFSQLTDQTQYALGLTWLFYFVVGMTIAHQSGKWLKLHRSAKQTLFLMLIWLGVASLCWAVSQGQNRINQGVDPIIALRFTRLPIITYSLSMIGLCLLWLESRKNHDGWWLWPIAVLGQFSYLIYLNHTVLLRIIFSGWYELVSWPMLAVVSMIWLIVTGVCLKFKLFE